MEAKLHADQVDSVRWHERHIRPAGIPGQVTREGIDMNAFVHLVFRRHTDVGHIVGPIDLLIIIISEPGMSGQDQVPAKFMVDFSAIGGRQRTWRCEDTRVCDTAATRESQRRQARREPLNTCVERQAVHVGKIVVLLVLIEVTDRDSAAARR